MSAYTTVPADIEPDSIIDLVEDCREVSGMLGSFVPAVHLPLPRSSTPVEIDEIVVANLEGYGAYGS